MVYVSVGDSVTVTPKNYDRAGSGFDRLTITDRINQSGSLRVTRVFAETVLVRGAILPHGGEASFHASKSSILTRNGVDTRTGEPFVPPRKIGTKPEDTPDMTYIGLDHPGIQWLFEDMGTYADDMGWCSTYDDLASNLGIPPRMSELSVSVTHNGIDVWATIKARNEEEAQEKLRAMLV